MRVVGCYFDGVFVSDETDVGCPVVSSDDGGDEHVAIVVERV